VDNFLSMFFFSHIKVVHGYFLARGIFLHSKIGMDRRSWIVPLARFFSVLFVHFYHILLLIFIHLDISFCTFILKSMYVCTTIIS